MRMLPIMTLAALGCGPSTSLVRLTPTTYEPRPADTNVLLYSARLPECPFEAITIASAKEEYELITTAAGVAEALRRKAREAGGDALFRVGFGGGGSVISGTVIRFTRDDCQR